MKNIYIIHENDEWTAPLKKHLDDLDLPYEDWFLDEGILDLSKEPPQGVFYNRMSASSHTRDHRYAPEYTAAVLAWLQRKGRKVINTEDALRLEVSKVAQYASLNAHGIKTPKTIAAVGREEIVRAAEGFITPFITKHNRAGKGLGVQLFQNIDALQEYVNGPNFEVPIDGITLIQQYIQSPEPFITRCEFIGGKFFYAVRVDTSEGFELCPADVCQIGEGACPVGEVEKPKFEVIEGFTNPILEHYEGFLRSNGIQIAGIEFITDRKGTIYTYDVNTNTNYNPEAEAVAEKYGMLEIAKYLGKELEKAEGK
ncbi:ATP-grasp domain-containing protein [Isachenkonia alkalipeptolytica]|uniref:Alpha-L-glutamate ligase n=1 Tax=Isachenkonia alkalipeptolytica TaxID=2565777 RepID=A0AA44BCM9_9CLOT|nr:alpha-L-glutamate ligase [Isachenkonia alkalipeptolytica]NBG87073.1 alpha-L-glutamate ligase [Isachenkonia alkalipeptolytica]